MNGNAEVPVLIVGGGIVGLSASLFLSYHGIRSLLVERHTGTSIHPRSRSFNVRTMELYRQVGAADAVREAGLELSLSRGIYRGSTLREVIGPHKRGPENPPPAGMPGDPVTKGVSPTGGARGTQDLVEPVLLTAARAQPFAEVRFHTECVDFEQRQEGVTAKLRNRDTGEVARVRAQYMIAADGAGSPVRQKLGIKMTGQGVLGHMLNILFEADLRDFVNRREFSICLIDQPKVRGLFSSVNNSTRWVFHACYDPEKGEKADDFTPERCKKMLEMALGMPEVEITVRSVLPWQSAVRVVQELQRGRIFLAGDAAHQMPPWRGQGANSGIADVHNLAWKLAAVLKGEAPSALLETYEPERLPVGRRAAEESGAASDEYGRFSLRWSLVFNLLRMGFLLTGYGYRYDSAVICPDDVSQFFRIPWNPVAWLADLIGRPGTRMPHLWVLQKGQMVSTLDLCKQDFVLFVGEEGGSAWRNAAAKTREALKVNMDVYSVGPSGDLVDSTYQWLPLAGISSHGALLVRSDQFVAWRSYRQPDALTERLAQAMKMALCR